MTHEGRRVAGREVLRHQPREVDVEENVRVVDDERALREHRLRVLERAAGPEDRVLGEEDDALTPGRGGGPGAQQVGLPVQIQPDLAVAHRCELAEYSDRKSVV